MAWNDKNMKEIKILINLPDDNGNMVLYKEDEVKKVKILSNRVLKSLQERCINYAIENYFEIINQKNK